MPDLSRAGAGVTLYATQFCFAYSRNQSYRLKLRTTSPTQYTFCAMPPVI